MDTQYFKPVEEEITGAAYTWNFGENATPSTTNGYGPHAVVFEAAGTQTIKLLIEPADPILANCPDSSFVDISVIQCLGNISGSVRTLAGRPIQQNQLKLFMDDNADGIPDTEESPFLPKITDAQGSYAFVNLPPGNFVIKQEQPAGYTTYSDGDISNDNDMVLNVDTLDNMIPVTLSPSENDVDNNFIEREIKGIVRGVVFEDQNQNDIPNENEGIEGVIVSLFLDANIDGVSDSDQPYSTVQTSSNGSFEFTEVDIQNYVLVEQQPPGYLSIKDIDASQDGDLVENTNMEDDTIPVSVLLAEIDNHNYFIEQLQTGQLFGHIYFDTNGDGVQDENGIDDSPGNYDDEPNWPNQDVIIRDTFGVAVDTVTTDEFGNWMAYVLPGYYLADVDENDLDYPANSIQTKGDDPTGPIMVSLNEIVDGGTDGYSRCTEISVSVFLEGSMIDQDGGISYNLEEMRTTLNENRLLPGQSFFGPIQGLVYTSPGQPFNQPPWNYTGSEGDMFDSGGDINIGDAGYAATDVDWVLVSLRESSDSPPVIMTSALLQNDGMIMFTEGTPACELNPLQSYFMVIEHRHHLIVMSHNKVPIDREGRMKYDFRHQESYLIPGSAIAQKYIGINSAGFPVYVMYGGNGQQVDSPAADTDINLNDLSFWSLYNNTISTYHLADFNMNGDINLNDQILFNINNGNFTSVPRNE
jgi:hypothetical protein